MREVEENRQQLTHIHHLVLIFLFLLQNPNPLPRFNELNLMILLLNEIPDYVFLYGSSQLISKMKSDVLISKWGLFKLY